MAGPKSPPPGSARSSAWLVVAHGLKAGDRRVGASRTRASSPWSGNPARPEVGLLDDARAEWLAAMLAERHADDVDTDPVVTAEEWPAAHRAQQLNMTSLEGLWMLPLLAVAPPDVGVHRAALDGGSPSGGGAGRAALALIPADSRARATAGSCSSARAPWSTAAWSPTPARAPTPRDPAARPARRTITARPSTRSVRPAEPMPQRLRRRSRQAIDQARPTAPRASRLAGVDVVSSGSVRLLLRSGASRVGGGG